MELDLILTFIVDILFVHPNSSKKVYQDLSKDFSAIEPPIWAAMLAKYVVDRGFSADVLDCEALRISSEQAASTILELKPKVVCLVAFGQQPSASTQCMPAGAKTCHIEAGLRTNNKLSPFPEEINRQITGRISDFHFAPTETSKNNLLKENISNDSILVTGNTVIDALLDSVKKVNKNPSNLINDLNIQIGDKELILITGHRRENHGKGFDRICKALKKIAEETKDCLIIYPVHLNPKVQEPVNRILSGINNIMLIDPLAYKDFIWLMNRAKIIITDSGGVQEEAPSLGKPVLVMRDTTERPEAVEAGTVLLVGTNEELIVSKALGLMNNKHDFEKMSKLHNPYGDGKASKRIVDFVKKLK